jgi:hypothetical protein
MPGRSLLWALGALPAIACGPSGPPRQPIYIEGRPVLALGDTAIAYTKVGVRGVLIVNRKTGSTDTLGAGTLHGPFNVEFDGTRWYVSDIEEGRPSIAIFGSDGSLEQRIDVSQLSATPHQFALLPDGRIVLEVPGGELVALAGDSVSTFARFRPGPKPGLLKGARGGVLHALPDRHVTLYNQFGNIRWRIEWPWRETAYISAISVDSNGRIHLIAGVPSEGTFIVYTLAAENGEVVRWSIPGPYASFTVDHFGEIRPDTTLPGRS